MSYSDGREKLGNPHCPFCSHEQSMGVYYAPWKDGREPRSCVMKCEKCGRDFVTEVGWSHVSYSYTDDFGVQNATEIEEYKKNFGYVTKELVDTFRKQNGVV
ncbi:MAG: hypothetical protein JNL11_17395 [Bdellovibrionaceae bacterium]|nr:hypothetical protein [Pseudobdellovibrionaceae bacterium]